MLFWFGLRSTSRTNDLWNMKKYVAWKGLMMVSRIALPQHGFEQFCKLGLRHATNEGRLRSSGFLWLRANPNLWQALSATMGAHEGWVYVWDPREWFQISSLQWQTVLK